MNESKNDLSLLDEKPDERVEVSKKELTQLRAAHVIVAIFLEVFSLFLIHVATVLPELGETQPFIYMVMRRGWCGMGLFAMYCIFRAATITVYPKK